MPTTWGAGVKPQRIVVPSLAALVALLLVFHGVVPNTPGHVGSLLETYLPWLGLAVPVLLALALVRRAVPALLALVLPATAWLALFGGYLLPDDRPEHDLTVVQHNVNDENPDPTGTARALLATHADLIALEEVTPPAVESYAATLAPRYPHHVVVGTVGLWSRYPLTDARPVDIRPHDLGPDWNRGLRATAETPQGDIAVYVAHLPSVRLGPTGLRSARRDESATLLGAAIGAEPLPRVILLGDLNSTVDDRGLAPVTARMTVPDFGFAFSWPAALPVARIDQVFVRSMTVTALWTVPATTSDHVPVAAQIRI
ncbi:endonuclease/exonuclease/phosphatase family protein [Longispora sp. K20-0274]|uniref:endonuclease/exonuclease/phosphatase family protein n=1 Tax=Longispora sp. K20-0274 TaxID=3088255 RepID=UPI00399AFA1A